jgi:hypothetical protein
VLPIRCEYTPYLKFKIKVQAKNLGQSINRVLITSQNNPGKRKKQGKTTCKLALYKVHYIRFRMMFRLKRKIPAPKYPVIRIYVSTILISYTNSVKTFIACFCYGN